MSEHTLGPWKFEKLLAGAWNIQGGPNAYYPVCSRLSTVEHMEQESYANAELIAQAWTIPALRGHLEQALRQWSMYAEFEEIDLTDEKSPEAEMYRAAKSALKLGQENG